jgi:hypothetical protein
MAITSVSLKKVKARERAPRQTSLLPKVSNLCDKIYFATSRQQHPTTRQKKAIFTMDPAYAFDKPGVISLSKPAMFLTSNAFNIPDGPEGRLCGNDSRCSNPGKSRCLRCKVDRYCSRDCQKAAWSSHKDHCAPFSAEPTNTIIDPLQVEEKDREAFMIENLEAMSRPNVLVLQKNSDSPASIVLHVLQQMFAEHHFRVGYYGLSRYSKAVILLDSQADCEALLQILRTSLGKMWGEDVAGPLLAALHDGMSPVDKQTLKDGWMHPKSTTRILLIASKDHLNYVAPDTEVCVVLMPSTNLDVIPRWQRMARMAGQKGRHVSVKPWKTAENLKWKTEEVEFAKKNGDDVIKWQPQYWATYNFEGKES